MSYFVLLLFLFKLTWHFTTGIRIFLSAKYLLLLHVFVIKRMMLNAKIHGPCLAMFRKQGDLVKVSTNQILAFLWIIKWLSEWLSEIK